MKFRYFTALLTALFFININAQSAHDNVLFVVDDEPVYTKEFLRVYNKNLSLVQDESQKDVDEYLKLFTNYKLKIKEAKALGLHEKPAYLRELNSYKKQLAKNFITDSKVTDDLIKEAYDRISYDVKANHILIKIPENANPQDTLVAYNNIMKLRDRTFTEGFDKVRKEVHNGKTIFGEELGYFTGFRMVYNFETVAFNTNVGDISMPFRTRFGYHILNVLNKRKSRGERTVAHIMVRKNPNDTTNNAEIRINEIYKKIQQGETFEALAKQFSEDKNSAPKGGLLASFSSGQLGSLEFEKVAFNLAEVNDVSEPIKTDFGWHIIKLHEKKLIPPFIDAKNELEEKVKRDDRSKLIDEALTNKLKAKYKVINNEKALAYFESILNEDYFKRSWQLPENFQGNAALIKIGNKTFTYKNFGDYLIKKQRSVQPKATFKDIVLNQYNTFLNDNLIQYQEDNLESENEDFANIVTEYREGLLLFELMETTIWNTAKTDTIGVKNFYNNNKSKYFFPKRVDAVVASSTKQKTLKKVAKLLKEGMPLDKIKNLVNSNDQIQVVFTTGIMDAEHQALPNNFEFKQGISKVYNHNNTFIVAQIKEVLPEQLKTFDEAKGAIISDYQILKENNWVKELSEKYKVTVNKHALKKVKSQIKNQ